MTTPIPSDTAGTPPVARSALSRSDFTLMSCPLQLTLWSRPNVKDGDFQ